jgi:hypothetical protein
VAGVARDGARRKKVRGQLKEIFYKIKDWEKISCMNPGPASLTPPPPLGVAEGYEN